MTADTLPRHIDRWVHGDCYPMAIALHQRTGWDICALVAQRENRTQAAHMWVAAPDGRWFDARGEITRDDLVQDYLDAQYNIVPGSVRWVEGLKGLPGVLALLEEIEPDWIDAAVRFLDQMLPEAQQALVAHPEMMPCCETTGA